MPKKAASTKPNMNSTKLSRSCAVLAIGSSNKPKDATLFQNQKRTNTKSENPYGPCLNLPTVIQLYHYELHHHQHKTSGKGLSQAQRRSRQKSKKLISRC